MIDFRLQARRLRYERLHLADALDPLRSPPGPALLRIEPNASHGYRPTDWRIAKIADVWAFAAEHLGLGNSAVARSD